MIIQKFEHCDILEVDELTETVRGIGREGSQGINNYEYSRRNKNLIEGALKKLTCLAYFLL